jgi:outer membrane protein TolC
MTIAYRLAPAVGAVWLLLTGGVAVGAEGAGPEMGAAPRIPLDQALAAARAANATLPVAGLDRQIAAARQREAEARRRWLGVLEGGLILAPESGYDPVVTNLGEERFQLALEKTLYDGGALAAEARRAAAGSGVAEAGFRRAVADVELDVRGQYAAALAAAREIAAREEGLRRLGSYLDWLGGRAGAGQAVTADLLRTRVRIAVDRAALVDARQRLDSARASLATLMGRSPDFAFEVAALPEPTAPADAGGDPGGVPGFEAARGEADVAAAGLSIARAMRKPRLDARFDVGLWGSDTTRLVPRDYAAGHPGADFADRLGRDLGYSLSFDFSWPLFDAGTRRAREAEATLALEQARRRVEVERVAAGRQLALARVAARRSYEQYRLLTVALPEARDAYLETESRYRGGAAGYLDVLDAFTTAVDAEVQAAQAELAYRVARALELRWGGDDEAAGAAPDRETGEPR